MTSFGRKGKPTELERDISDARTSPDVLERDAPAAGGVFVAGREEFPAGDVCVRADFRVVANIPRLSRAT
jgi:hypothetical protein